MRLILLLLVLLVLATPPALADDAPRHDFERRVRALSAGQIDEAVELGRIAQEHGWLRDAERLFRATLHHDPSNDEAWQSLRAVCDARLLPTSSDALDAVRPRLDERFVQTETAHFVVLSDADPQWVRIQSRRLEKAHDRFMQFALSMDLRPLPLRHKLVAILFSERGAFFDFSRAEGGPTSPNVAGYYEPAADHLVFYHVESHANIEAARDSLERTQQRINRSRKNLRQLRNRQSRGQARELRRRINDAEAHQQATEARLNELARERSVQVTVHEAIHQLAFHTEVQSPYSLQPLWISEGLATVFETNEVGVPFGPNRDFMPRRERFEELMLSGDLLPLRELVGLGHEALRGDGDTIEIIYHQSYALVTWLSRHRKLGFRDYLVFINAMRGADFSSEDQVMAFEIAFGNLAELEKTWLRAEGAPPE